MTPVQHDISDVDTTARWPLSVLVASGILWLLVSSGLALLHWGQAFDPTLLADWAPLSYGRLRGLHETAFVYGWVANAGFAMALWVLGRLGGTPLRSLQWAIVGALFWNLGVTLGLVGIAIGDGSSLSLLRMPSYVQPLLLIAAGAIAVPGVLAWTGRTRKPTFAAQWFAVAALFLFPWLFSAAQLMLVAAPVRGVLQAVVAGWFVQGMWTLWIAPLALAVAYYLVPKITGRPIPTYDFAPVSFWLLLVVGGWTGGRHLIGGPVPAWIATVAIVSCVLLTFHYLITALNLREAFGHPGFSLRFVAFGVAAYVAGGLGDAITALRSVAEITQFTWMAQAQSRLALAGAFSMIIFGAIYFVMPRITNRPWPSIPLIRAHYSAAVVGVIALVGGLAAAGIVQGRDLGQATVSFATIATHTRPWLLTAAAGEALLLLGNLMLAFHFVRLLATRPVATATDLLRPPATMEASVS